MVFTDELAGPGWADLARRLEGDGFSTLLVVKDRAFGPAVGASGFRQGGIRAAIL